MNRRHRAGIALVIAVGLFAAPLVSPVPDYGPHVKIDPNPISINEMKERTKKLDRDEMVRYQNLSVPAQHVFDRMANKNVRSSAEPTVPVDEAPEPWATLAQKGESDAAIVYVRKDGQYYYTWVFTFIPRPSFQSFMLRLGPLLGAIGLGMLAGYFVLTTEG